MTATQDIRDVFSILHDGVISAWSGDKSLLTLTVECKYLAKRINKSFDIFYVELAQVENMFFSTWPNPPDLPVQILTDPVDIFKADLEILSADIKDEVVIVTCNQDYPDFDFSGGTLIISCRIIKVFDQNKDELTIDQFDKICNSYWEERIVELIQLLNVIELKSRPVFKEEQPHLLFVIHALILFSNNTIRLVVQ